VAWTALLVGAHVVSLGGVAAAAALATLGGGEGIRYAVRACEVRVLGMHLQMEVEGVISGQDGGGDGDCCCYDDVVE
jgi:hypothetical protein